MPIHSEALWNFDVEGTEKLPHKPDQRLQASSLEEPPLMSSPWLLLTDNRVWATITPLHLPAHLQVLAPNCLTLTPRGRFLPSLGVIAWVDLPWSPSLSQDTTLDHSKVALGCKHVICLAQSCHNGKGLCILPFG